TTIFINNAIYGMTGGQMAPTTLVGQVTTTSPYGRQKEHCGEPIRIAEMLATINGSAFIARTALNNAANIRKTKAAIKKAFQMQIEGKGFSLVEVLSPCPTNWGKSPAEAMDWLQDNMIPYYPLGTFKEV
ncbi:MAG: 2-oxoglutarate oxidoreductase, partial [Oscillospiraceae bacterium]|nr:2-oxoglutarate oxidoreductase [Oscillospiraceae bacterium]